VRVPDAAPPPWPTATPEQAGIDPAALQRALASLPADEAAHGLRSLLLLRRGQLVLERYWNGRDREVQQDLRSATKSITSLLVGMALQRGRLRGLHEPLATRLAAAYPGAPALQQGITLEHLLGMRSGLACDDRDPASPGHEDTMYEQRDWVAFFLALPSREPPGGAGHYCTGGVVALGRVLSEAEGRPIPALAEDWLFGPLGIVGARWSSFDQGRQTDTGGHLYLRPVDMLRIGALVLQRGQWNGRSLVPADWIEASTREQARIDGGRPFGWLWWPGTLSGQGRELPAALAAGNGGQLIVVVPALELVMVSTGGHYNSPKAGLAMQLLRQHILPAIGP
jgi:CubicO group peptidase (beta-lactamase class C family)